MSDWLTVVCVRVCWVKVGYSLLLGHVANPLTLAWILLTDPFSSNKTHTPPWRSRPPGLGYRCQSARAARRSFHIVATLKHPLLPTTTLQICFFVCLFSLACPQTPSSFVAADERAVLHRLSLKRFEFPFESEWRRSLRCPWRFAFGWPMSCWQKQRRLHLRVTLKMSPWLCSRVKLTRRQLQSVFVPHVSNCIQW